MPSAPNAPTPDHAHLRAAGVSLALDLSGGTLPRVLHWGADLGENADLDALRTTSLRQPIGNSIAGDVAVAVLPEQSAGWLGTPGLVGNRAGRDFSTAFRVVDTSVDGGVVVTTAEDPAAGLALTSTVELTPSGVVRQRAELTNTGDSPFALDALNLTLPVPPVAVELLDFT
ncbi:MAG TPA: glycoside hydrolase family 36 N-terminal domain-containing protein, partial [Umezawaea sp.]|nr:glycoside hydrolase family 36 N-terminal domain-containing protein [Umezawaea sp.]